MKFSIVVAAYNVEKTILYTLNSLESQIYKNFEVIIVNDSSTDNTDFVINCFIEKSNIKNISYIKNQTNQGLSVVRNIGINQANGDYVLFLDGDDAYHSESLRMLDYRINSYSNLPDALIFSAATFVEDITPMNESYNIGNYIQRKGYDRIDLSTNLVVGIDWFKEAYQNGTFFDAAQLNVFNLNYLRKNNIGFIPGLIFEDTLFTRNVLIKSENIGVSNELIILIRKAEGSIMRSPLNIKKIISRYIIAKELFLFKKKYQDSFFYHDSLNMLLINLRAIKKSDQLFFPTMWRWILIYFYFKECKVRNLVFYNLKTDLKKLIGYTNNI